MNCHVVVTTAPDIVGGLDGLCDRLAAQLDGQTPDLLLAFYTPHHSAEIPALRERLLARFSPRVLLGSPAAGVAGEDVEIEGQAGFALWAACWPGVELVPFHLATEFAGDDSDPVIHGWPEQLPDDPGLLLLADAYTTPSDDLLSGCAERWPEAPTVGGLASGTSGPGDAQFMTNAGIVDSGCVGVGIGGSVRMDPVVSQGCRPVGRHFVITRAESNMMFTLGGKPALSQLKNIVAESEPRDRELLQRALHVGRVVDERKSRFTQGDFLVRNVMSYDAESGAVAISDYVRAGQTIQFMVRDAAAASDELTQLLAREKERGPALGALLFSCNGRGERFFGKPHHDIGQVRSHLPETPTAGMFCGGEIGPVGGQPFLHGFTASIALFRARN